MKKVLKHILYVIIFFIGMLINPSFAASNSANIPVVVPGLTPVKYNAGNWEVTTNMDSDWYDYENGVWANARTNNGYQYVWIPRFTYKIEGEKISIKWSDGKNDDTTDGYLRHPAFYFGEYIGGDTLSNANFIERNGQRNELTGFWIQKDLFSTNITSVSNAFNNSIKMTQNTAYGLPQSGTYTHMTKASEWGALVYLTQAKGRLTGGTRTTLNQTGVNIGSAQEYVLGLKGSPSTNIDILSPTYKRYRDVLDNSLENYYGYAISETKGLANTSGELSENSFLVRGGSLGLFGYVSGNGNDSGKGYRTSISVVTEELTDTIAFFDTETSVVSGDYLILGVDFYVQENWKFPANPVDFFVNLEDIEDKKVIDMECIYEGSATWHQKDLHAQVIKMIKPDFTIVEASNINSTNTYSPGKYTLVVRIGGYHDDNSPVFMRMDNMDVKVVVNQLNLRNTSGDLIKIDRIPNNKVRLNIFGQSLSNVVSKVVLLKAPTKTEYELDEELNLSGGIIVPYLGDLAGEEIAITLNEVVNPNITSTSGEHQVELTYDGMTVVQEDEKFIINVSDVKQLVVNGEVKLGNKIVTSQFRGPGKYSRATSDKSVEFRAASKQ